MGTKVMVRSLPSGHSIGSPAASTRVSNSAASRAAGVTSEQGPSSAPASAPGEAHVVLGHKIRSISHELRIYTESAEERSFDLAGVIVPRTKNSRGQLDELLECGHVTKQRAPQAVGPRWHY